MATMDVKNVILGIIFTFLLFVVSCNNLSVEKYDKLKVGMSYDEVVSLLGKPTECNGAIGIKNCIWGKKTKNIEVSFGGNKVLVFSSSGL
jgi:hypothetical protein